MPVYVGSARLDERNKISGGAAGDQTGKEVAYQSWYLHSKGWIVLRAKDPAMREKIAYAMKAACDNNNIGYDQTNRSGLYNAVKGVGFDPAKCTVLTETDCSALIRVCVCYAAGRNIPDFNTASEYTVLMNTGLFDNFKDDAHCKSSENLLPGDILVTRTKGHTVAVISVPSSNKSNTSTSSSLLKKGSKGDKVKELQTKLNKTGAGLSADGIYGPATETAVKNFQKKYGLAVDGICGPATTKKLDEVISKPVASSSLLRKGDKGDKVKELQTKLNNKTGAGLVVDGSFGPATETAVKNFQKKYGLAVDGICGPATTKKLDEVISKPVASSTLKKGSKGDNVRVLQNNLNEAIGAGISVDGSFGPATETAVKNFQKKYGLAVDGIYGPKSASKMRDILL